MVSCIQTHKYLAIVYTKATRVCVLTLYEHGNMLDSAYFSTVRKGEYKPTLKGTLLYSRG